MSSIKTTQVDGDVAIGRNVAMGGKLDVAGSATICHNLKVDGWLEARNIKGVNKGVFTSVTKLREAYPTPHDGWLAGVGDSSPFAAYVGDGGDWVATGGEISLVVDFPLSSIKGYVVVSSTGELPPAPTVDERQTAYLLGSTLYVYVGAGGDTLDGKYQGVDLQGPQGNPGVSLGEVELVDDLTTGGSDKALSARQGVVLKGLVDAVTDGVAAVTERSGAEFDVAVADRDNSVNKSLYIRGDGRLTGPSSSLTMQRYKVPEGCGVRVRWNGDVPAGDNTYASAIAWFAEDPFTKVDGSWQTGERVVHDGEYLLISAAVSGAVELVMTPPAGKSWLAVESYIAGDYATVECFVDTAVDAVARESVESLAGDIEDLAGDVAVARESVESLAGDIEDLVGEVAVPLERVNLFDPTQFEADESADLLARGSGVLHGWHAGLDAVAQLAGNGLALVKASKGKVYVIYNPFSPKSQYGYAGVGVRDSAGGMVRNPKQSNLLFQGENITVAEAVYLANMSDVIKGIVFPLYKSESGAPRPSDFSTVEVYEFDSAPQALEFAHLHYGESRELSPGVNIENRLRAAGGTLLSVFGTKSVLVLGDSICADHTWSNMMAAALGMREVYNVARSGARFVHTHKADLAYQLLHDVGVRVWDMAMQFGDDVEGVVNQWGVTVDARVRRIDHVIISLGTNHCGDPTESYNSEGDLAQVREQPWSESVDNGGLVPREWYWNHPAGLSEKALDAWDQDNARFASLHAGIRWAVMLLRHRVLTLEMVEVVLSGDGFTNNDVSNVYSRLPESMDGREKDEVRVLLHRLAYNGGANVTRLISKTAYDGLATAIAAANGAAESGRVVPVVVSVSASRYYGADCREASIVWQTPHQQVGCVGGFIAEDGKLMGGLTYNERIKRVERIVCEACADLAVPVIKARLCSGISESDELTHYVTETVDGVAKKRFVGHFLRDGIHLNEKGYRLFADMHIRAMCELVQ